MGIGGCAYERDGPSQRFGEVMATAAAQPHGFRERLVDADEVGERLAVGPKEIRRMWLKGILPSVLRPTVRGDGTRERRFMRLSDLEAYLADLPPAPVTHGEQPSKRKKQRGRLVGVTEFV
jgi:hypothetical protein